MDESASSTVELPPEDVEVVGDASSASPIRLQTSLSNRHISSQGARKRYRYHRRSSINIVVGNANLVGLLRVGSQASIRSAEPRWQLPTPIAPRKRQSRSQTFAADISSERSLIGCSILPSPRRRSFLHFFGGLIFSRSSSSSEQSAKQNESSRTTYWHLWCSTTPKHRVRQRRYLPRRCGRKELYIWLCANCCCQVRCIFEGERLVLF